ncbi:MAG TPA: AMP-binding protein, partial [Candidatus Wallbacteria bacterium]|nr:AMP-binding protein [Candidatus Wallbacteria bacterium]
MFENFLEALKKHSETSPAKTALCVKRGGEYVKYSYARFYELVCSVSNALIEKGVAKNDFVGLFSENSPEWVIAYFSIYASGAAVVPLDAQYTARELSNLLPFAGVKTIFCSSNLYDKTVKSLNESLKFENIFLTDDSGGANSMFKMPVHKGYRVSRSPEDRMSLIFTSGTTGDPKGVVLTDKNFHSNVSSIIAIGGIMDE